MVTTFNETYEIKGLIGKGGMSAVYLAEHKRLHTKWAVKEVSKQQGAQFDFLAESNILKKLQHPMLPRIVDIFEDSERVLIVEDYVEGMSLEALLRQQKQVDEALGLQWFQALCDVLDYLHSQQPNPIIYRDMKPSNIMLQTDGMLKLIDFGIAREYKEASTGDTTYIGTKGYAAPEQFGTAQTDARTDIYALGVTMYHLLTGKSPYEPPYQFVPANQLNPALSHGITYILDKCIRPEPADRYQSIPELMEDLTHIYRFDRAWKKYESAKRARVITVAVTLAASIALMAAGWVTLGKEKEENYLALLGKAATMYTADYDGAVAALDEARAMFPDRIEPDRQQTYALYLNGRWQECVEFGQKALAVHGEDRDLTLSVASAQFELGDYRAAAEGFSSASTSEDALSEDHLRDYAVCLGRLGQTEQAQSVLKELTAKGGSSDVTRYVQGELFLSGGSYLEAEEIFLGLLDEARENALIRRCYIALGDLYRDCAALARMESSPIPEPATKSVEVLSRAVVQDNLRYDSTLWEMLGMAYFESYHTDTSVPESYLRMAGDCFNRVIELGITKEYLYTNLYTIFYEMKDYDRVEQALASYEHVFPDSYVPHALRGIMLISIENEKEQSERDYTGALREYETAGSLIRSSDETSYYQQMESLIQSLRANGWI